MSPLNKEILRLALPSILANLTIPLVGFVDTAVAGHLTGESAAFIGAISLGSMIFNLIYWNFAFLRTGTGGLTAQAFGRKDMHECAKLLYRTIALALVFAIIALALQKPFVKLVLSIVKGSEQAEALAAEYFLIRIWAAPATMSLMGFTGWFVGMQDSMSTMWKDLIVNVVNIVASIVLAFGFGPIKGMGFAGIAAGTVIAQYCGLIYCMIKVRLKYREKVLYLFSLSEFKSIFNLEELIPLFKMNNNLLIRSLGFTAIYIGYTVIAAKYGDMVLACSSIMMQILMIFSYFTDGFAYAAEALVGRFTGENNTAMLHHTAKNIFYWSMAIAGMFIFVYAVCGVPILRVLTSDQNVIEECSAFLPWLLVMPPIGCAAFTWDGVFLGATATAQIRDSMVGASVAFLGVWIVLKSILAPQGELAMHCLMGAYFAHLLFRTVYLTATHKEAVYHEKKKKKRN